MERVKPGRGAIRLLTLNLGLLGFELRNGWRMPLAPSLELRLAAAPGLLSAVDADILALQEVYRPADRRFLLGALSGSFPFHVDAPPSRALIGSGLMLFSRFPILQSAFIPCRPLFRPVALVQQQGFLAAEIDLPFAGRTRLINVHLTASGLFGEANLIARRSIHRREIAWLLEAARTAPAAAILIGDFNTGPVIHPHDYRAIINAGYKDAFLAASREAERNDGFTWDAANPLNRRGRYRASPSQRIDHLFTLEREASIDAVGADIVFRDPCVETKSKQCLPLSDHYGVIFTLNVSSHSLSDSSPLPLPGQQKLQAENPPKAHHFGRSHL